MENYDFARICIVNFREINAWELVGENEGKSAKTLIRPLHIFFNNSSSNNNNNDKYYYYYHHHITI